MAMYSLIFQANIKYISSVLRLDLFKKVFKTTTKDIIIPHILITINRLILLDQLSVKIYKTLIVA
jgi:hypothetical protein